NHPGWTSTNAYTNHTTEDHIMHTGATGLLVSELLHRLARRTDARITCLVRGGRNIPQDGARVDRVAGDLTQPHAGLSDNDWEHLTASVDCICHAGASINWVGSYEAL